MPADRVLQWCEEVPGSAAVAGLALTGRPGGAGVAPYDSLNLATSVGDDPSTVSANRRRVADATGVGADRVVFMRQVHGRDVEVVTGPRRGEPPAVDALVSDRPGLVLAVLVADCAPVLVADPDAGVVGVAHAGRQGLVAGVVPALVEAARKLGARRLTARVGPSVCGRCYEVPASMRAEVAALVPQAWSVTRSGTPGLDVAAGVVAQLRAAGASVQQVAGCTLEGGDLFSYRRDGVTGRFAGLAWMREAG